MDAEQSEIITMVKEIPEGSIMKNRGGKGRKPFPRKRCLRGQGRAKRVVGGGRHNGRDLGQKHREKIDPDRRKMKD